MTIPLRCRDVRRDLNHDIDWYNEHRPHTKLKGCTPNEIYFGRKPANRRRVSNRVSVGEVVQMCEATDHRRTTRRRRDA